MPDDDSQKPTPPERDERQRRLQKKVKEVTPANPDKGKPSNPPAKRR